MYRFTLPSCALLFFIASILGESSVANADFPWISSGMKRSSDHWWHAHSGDPVGARQVQKYGKQWPPFARPVGPAQLPMHRFHAAHYWPYPYNEQDQSFVRTLSRAHVDSGWVTAITLFDYHFDADSQELNRSGRLHLRWILENAPERHRMALVQSAGEQTSNTSRVDSVRIEATRIVGKNGIPPIMLRVTTPTGRPAEEVDMIRRQEMQSLPEPRITPAIASGGGEES